MSGSSALAEQVVWGTDSLLGFQEGPLAQFFEGGDVLDIGAATVVGVPSSASHATVFAGYKLQDIVDYRGAIRAWFQAVRTGGHLIIVVPHAFLHDRKLHLPSPWNPAQRRLYTPQSLLEEVEEALEPNSYRIRSLSDDDRDYDYDLDPATAPSGRHDIVLVLERIAAPAWALIPRAQATVQPDFAFEPNMTRVEFARLKPRDRILILKLDHLGDFIMGLGALEKVRERFPDAEITLVVGSWNLAMAREMALADHILAFDVFPRNSSEERVDVRGKAALFQALIKDEYHLAIDLRTDSDTRFLLESVKAKVRAGVGTRSQFPFLDIFLPIDFTRNEPETAKVEFIGHRNFSSQPGTVRGDYRIVCQKEKVKPDCAVIWGPYFKLRPGRYFFEPHVELDPAGDGMLSYDIALDTKWVRHIIVSSPGRVRLEFTVEKPDTKFEFRIWVLEDRPAIDFSFFGGKLVREGASSVLHQSEYLMLLIELVAMRMERTGLLESVEPVA